MLDRRQVVKNILAHRKDQLIISGLGASTYDVANAGDHPLNFYFWGAMGGAVPCGLGLALTQPDRQVIVITGDGEMLMGLGSLATIAQHLPKNLSVIVLDNERYGETGQQDTVTAAGVALDEIAAACGFKANCVSNQTELDDLLPQLLSSDETLFSVVKVSQTEHPRILPLRDGVEIKVRFKQALGS